MWDSFLTCFNRVSLHQTVLEPRESTANAKAIYRDELDKKTPKRKLENSKDQHPTYSKPLLPLEDGKEFEKGSGVRGSGNKKEVIRIKVRMTKEEAARMLSKCKDGGRLEFKDLALELVQLPMNRVSVVSPNTISDPVLLESIPEEL